MNGVIKVLKFILEVFPSLISLISSLGSSNKDKPSLTNNINDDEFEDPR